jgi:pimeloyl-ACP methyl ester carboxylesterase
VRACRYDGPPDRLVVGVPGLGGNARCFDFLAERLVAAGHGMVNVDLRGRGRSSVSALGSYGWRQHARDVLAVAARFGSGPVDLVGHSMGALVAMQAAALAPGAVRRIVGLDAVGLPDPLAAAVIMQVASRLAYPGPSVEDYLARVRRIGVFEPWNEYWEQVFRYELTAADGSVRPLTSLRAVMEDTFYACWHDPRRLWASLTVPVLLVRAARPLLPGPGRRGAGLVVSPEDLDRFVAAVPQARVADVDANHYGVLMHESTASAVVEFLR